MLDRFLVVLAQVVTLFLLMGVGFVLGKKGLLTAEGTGQLSTLLLNVVTPCMIVNAFPADYDAATLKALGLGLAATVGSYLLYILLVRFLFGREVPEAQAPLRFGSMYGNVGFMGFPLVSAVLGQEALLYAAIFVVVFNLCAFTHGAVMMGGREAISVKKALLNPGVIGVAIGLPLFLCRLSLPGPIQGAVTHLSNLNTPLAMLIIGAQMSRADLAATFQSPVLYRASAVKLLLIPALTALVMLPLRATPLFYTTAVILAGTPAAGTTSIFAERYHKSPALAAQLVSLSTLLSVLTLPIVAVAAELLVG